MRIGQPGIVMGLVLIWLPLFGCAQPTLKQVNIDPNLTAEEAHRQRELVVRSWAASSARLHRVAHRVTVAAAPFCEDELEAKVGVIALNAAMFPPEYQSAAASVFGAGSDVKVIHVLADSPASEAGFQEGDIISKIGRVQLANSPRALDQMKVAFSKQGTSKRVPVSVRRGAEQMDINLQPERGCAVPIELSESAEVNAYSDGENLLVTLGLLDFVENDDELALVLAHEMAHHVLGHVDAKKQNAVAGAVVGLLVDVLAAAGGVNTQGGFTEMGMNVGAQAYSQDFEAEADYMGQYILARADYDLRKAPNFFRKLAIRNPDSIAYAHTHPTTAQRAVALETIAAEVERKRASGLPLVPDEAE